MARGDKRGNRESKKPKQEKTEKPAPLISPFASVSGKKSELPFTGQAKVNPPFRRCSTLEEQLLSQAASRQLLK